MLHDIVRFEQIKRYNTFSDAKSVDHAVFGADLLFGEGMIKDFDLDLSEEELSILEKSIRYHSAYRLPEELSDNEIKYCNVLRDADKVDIFRACCDTPFEQIYNVTTEELRNSALSDEIKVCFNNRTTVLRKLKQNPADYIVGHICLVFELVYPISREIARRQGYIDRLLDFRSDNPDTIQWFRYMRENIWK